MCFVHSASAAPADVIKVVVENKANSRFTFHVTINHPDEGWSHYVDRWEVRTTDDIILAVRQLRHPHVEEQPFTRFLPNIPVPESIETVVIHAHCSMDNYGGQTIKVSLQR